VNLVLSGAKIIIIHCPANKKPEKLEEAGETGITGGTGIAGKTGEAGAR